MPTVPVGKVGGVITREVSMVRLRLLVVAVLPSESVTLTVKVKVPDAVGVAVAIVPLAPRDNGLGSDPENNVYV